jgi:hypothetical protein
MLAVALGLVLSLAGIWVTGCLMRRYKRKRGAKVTGRADPEGLSVVSQIDGPLVKFFEGPPGEYRSTVSHYRSYSLALSNTSRAERQMR